MLQTRIIPALLLQNESLVKTRKFHKASYIGDPVNTVRIFNELEVDELVFLDIAATNASRQPNLKILSEIANECFMPLAYGGGISTLDQAKQLFTVGFEKIILNSAPHENMFLISDIANHFGSQAIIVSIDVKKNIWQNQTVWSHSGKQNTKKDPALWAKEVEQMGAGEILLTSIDREGTWSGFDLDLVRNIANSVNIPVIAHGGAGNPEHIRQVVFQGKASAVALGSMVVYQKEGMGVLVNMPSKAVIEEVF
jgi:imidazole glycerol-phosphate synthase subunit HisF